MAHTVDHHRSIQYLLSSLINLIGDEPVPRVDTPWNPSCIRALGRCVKSQSEQAPPLRSLGRKPFSPVELSIGSLTQPPSGQRSLSVVYAALIVTL
jgi:hypothetical protein